ncbi:asparagine synthase (glutamine-hydrolyzing) [Sphingomonas sp.]|uniref:asparagine synthase (glutamine-hydrolyzing) n=1 Tax=Sphingomonas sp. TaxID=28214 RepID=UPI0038AA4E61
MCGIAGAIGALRPSDRQACEAMSNRLRHRGPDDAGSWTWQVGASFGAVLCHRRLSIIDLRSIAAEPMISPATGTTLVFNGEIYNFQSLRAELEAAGARFVTNGDTEVILHGYDLWGVDVFARLRGMFAIVLVDPRKGRAILARDGYGIKPLYWASFAGTDGRPALAFASEGRALVEGGFADRRTDAGRIGQYLWNGFMPGPHTIWTQVKDVPRGCYAIIDEHHFTPRFERFWRIGSSLATGDPISAEEADRLITETVKLHLIADVPKVVFLSGGVDSTAVAAAAAAQAGDLETLSVAFDVSASDESRFAASAATAIGSRHHVVELSAARIVSHLSDAVAALDQPSFDGINSWFVCREAARLGFKVALSGAGGDELAGGYTSFRRAMRGEPLMRVPGSRLAARIAGYALQQLRPASKAGQLGRGFGALDQMYQTQYALFSTGTIRRLLINADELTPWGVEEERACDLSCQISPLSTLRAVTALESEMYLGDRLLRDMDSVSMAHSIELRVPLVDTFLSDALAGLSDEDRYLPIGEKRLLRRQSKAVLPDRFFARPKRGFEFPMDSWMRGPLRQLIEADLLDGQKCAALGLRSGEVAKIWKRFLDRPGAIYWTRPWALFSLLHWSSINGVSCGGPEMESL